MKIISFRVQPVQMILGLEGQNIKQWKHDDQSHQLPCTSYASWSPSASIQLNAFKYKTKLLNLKNNPIQTEGQDIYAI